MSLSEWLYTLAQYLVLLPSAALCYLPMRNRLKYTPAKTAALCLAVLIPYIMTAAWVQAAFRLDSNIPFLPFLLVFFLLYRRTVDTDLARTLAVFVSVCAVQTFTAYLEDVFIAYRYPQFWDAGGSVQAALLQAGLACLVAASFFPLRRPILWSIDGVDSLRVWYSITAISGLFLMLNLLLIPDTPEMHYAGTAFHLLPLLEGCIFALLVCVYVLFYQGARLSWEQSQLERRTQLLEIQARQYRA